MGQNSADVISPNGQIRNDNCVVDSVERSYDKCVVGSVERSDSDYDVYDYESDGKNIFVKCQGLTEQLKLVNISKMLN